MRPNNDRSEPRSSRTEQLGLAGEGVNEHTSDAVAAICTRFREAIDDLDRHYPELILVEEELARVIRHDTDPLREVERLLTACRDVFVRLRHLVNPVGLPVHVTQHGRILTSTFPNVGVFVTDIRGFTSLSQHVQGQWGTNIFQVLSYCYFPHVVTVLEHFCCHYLNYTGDGLVVLSPERRDETGKVCLPSLDNAVLCALDIVSVTNSIAEAWKSLGLVQDNGIWHETGLGLTFGEVQIGDPFVPDAAATGKLAQFEEVLRGVLKEDSSYCQQSRDLRRRILGVQALSPVINRASRLQDMDKLAPRHTCMMTMDDVAKLCPALRQRFQPVGNMQLRGIGEVEVLGVDRFEPVDTNALGNECRRFYA